MTMKYDNKIKSLIKNDYIKILNKSRSKKLDARISKKIQYKNSIKTLVITFVVLIGAAVFSYSIALLLN